ncbi:hypothetical protein SKAU_G00122250 [Synaphobranchus kaupii]|uniref:Uncharacterized protein n=1 Tax=Synaphobranchus kaupii TaxID=118154 RepID=A0A9Q1J1J4_SYNKA|nr:hypothetical protein SKAU_G00122250 [Synaphobranchus kaupii]
MTERGSLLLSKSKLELWVTTARLLPHAHRSTSTTLRLAGWVRGTQGRLLWQPITPVRQVGPVAVWLGDWDSGSPGLHAAEHKGRKGPHNDWRSLRPCRAPPIPPSSLSLRCPLFLFLPVTTVHQQRISHKHIHLQQSPALICLPDSTQTTQRSLQYPA